MTEEQKAELAFKLAKKRIQAQVKQKIRKNAKSLAKCIEDLKRCEMWEVLQHEGMLLQANIFRLHKGMSEVAVLDWEKEGTEITLSLDPLLKPNEIIASRFKMARKLKRGLPYRQNIMENLQKEIIKWDSASKELENIVSLPSLHSFANSLGLQIEPQPKHSDKEKAVKTLPYHKFYSASGFPIWVGKNATSNDKLTFIHAKGSDRWLHVHNFPGSHVVIRMPKNQEPDEDTLQDACQMAIAYSKAKDKGEAEICLTQCKYVSRIGKNQPGKVQISRHKILYVRFDPDRYQNIKSRSSLRNC